MLRRVLARLFGGREAVGDDDRERLQALEAERRLLAPEAELS
jgi:hypothetical protein